MNDSTTWGGNAYLERPGQSFSGQCLGRATIGGYQSSPSCSWISAMSFRRPMDPDYNYIMLTFSSPTNLSMDAHMLITFRQNVSTRHSQIQGTQC